jgi:hypothetical protein
MKKMMSALLVVLMCSSVQAVLITSNTAGQLFFDDFESYAVGTTVSGLSSSWINTNGCGITIVRDSDPVANQGSKYLGISQPSDPQKFFAKLSSTQTSGILTMQFALYAPTTTASYIGTIQMEPDTTDATLAAGIIILQDGSVKYYNNGWNSTGLTVTKDAWQDVTLTYNLNTDVFNVDIAGQNATVTGTGLTRTVGAVFFSGANAGGAFAIDAVPEPTTIAFLLVSMIAGVSRRNTK